MIKQDFINLYLSCFPEDTLQDAESLWDMTPENRIMAIYEAGVPCSMLVLMDGSLVQGNKHYPLFYVYAACTHPLFRKQGKMSELLKLSYDKALKEKRHGLFLNPASASLVDYYGGEGFDRFSSIRTVSVSSSTPSSGKKLKELSVQDGIICRNKLIETSFKNYINWDPNVINAALSFSIESGGGIYSDSLEHPSFFITAQPKDNVLMIKEAIGNKVMDYIPGLAYALNCEKAYVRLPGTIHDKCFGMLLSESIPSVDGAYMGIALD